ncbi:hypothetical protein GZL_04176 [Streptomyces sp. 769]|nr:hypothetical protein GZL_04176 [Streptomyces sp. 769]
MTGRRAGSSPSGRKSTVRGRPRQLGGRQVPGQRRGVDGSVGRLQGRRLRRSGSLRAAPVRGHADGGGAGGFRAAVVHRSCLVRQHGRPLVRYGYGHRSASFPPPRGAVGYPPVRHPARLDPCSSVG